MKTTKHFHGHRWTNEELKNLMIMWAADDSLEKIASQLKVTTTAILKQVQRMRKQGIPLAIRRNGHVSGVKNKNWTQGEVEYVLRRRNEKATSEEIGVELGRSTNAVNGLIGRLRKENVDVKMRGNGVRKLWDVNSLKALSLNSALQ